MRESCLELESPMAYHRFSTSIPKIKTRVRIVLFQTKTLGKKKKTTLKFRILILPELVRTCEWG